MNATCHQSRLSPTEETLLPNLRSWMPLSDTRSFFSHQFTKKSLYLLQFVSPNRRQWINNKQNKIPFVIQQNTWSWWNINASYKHGDFNHLTEINPIPIVSSVLLVSSRLVRFLVESKIVLTAPSIAYSLIRFRKLHLLRTTSYNHKNK